MAVGEHFNEGHRKPLMLFVHGFPEAWFSWRYQLRAFQDSHEVAAVELRGYGLSEKPKVASHHRALVLASCCLTVRMQIARLVAVIRQSQNITLSLFSIAILSKIAMHTLYVC